MFLSLRSVELHRYRDVSLVDCATICSIEMPTPLSVASQLLANASRELFLDLPVDVLIMRIVMRQFLTHTVYYSWLAHQLVSSFAYLHQAAPLLQRYLREWIPSIEVKGQELSVRWRKIDVPMALFGDLIQGSLVATRDARQQLAYSLSRVHCNTYASAIT